MDVAVYCFKKALLTIHAVTHKYQNVTPPPFPLPRTSHLPVFSDNVIPSLLVHLGVLDLSSADPALNLPSLFPAARDPATLAALLAIAYAAVIFVYRSYKLRHRHAEGMYYDKYGPTVLSVFLVGALATNIVLRIREI